MAVKEKLSKLDERDVAKPVYAGAATSPKKDEESSDSIFKAWFITQLFGPKNQKPDETLDKNTISEAIKKAQESWNSAFDTYTSEDAAMDRQDGIDFGSADDVGRYMGQIYSRGRSFGGTGGKLTNVPLNERRSRVLSVMDDAASKAGISTELMKGMWHVESGFGENRKSPTGCTGDWQFTRGTFNAMIRKYGHEIPGLQAKLNSGLDLRDDPEISTYAAAFYIRDLSKSLGINPNNRGNFGALYAAYNVGPGGAQQLFRLAENDPQAVAKQRLGFVAAVNPKFYVGGATASEALGNYQDAVEFGIRNFDHNFNNSALAVKRGQSVRVAGNDRDDDQPRTTLAATSIPRSSSGGIVNSVQKWWGSLDLNPFT